MNIGLLEGYRGAVALGHPGGLLQGQRYYIYIYIYIERERERERDMYMYITNTNTCYVCVCIHIYIYIYIHIYFCIPRTCAYYVICNIQRTP